MAKHHPDLIFCRKQPGVGKYTNNKFILYFIHQLTIVVLEILYTYFLYIQNA